MKWLLRIVIVLVVLLAIALVAAYLAINTLAKHGVERGATYALGVDTALDSIAVGVFSGELGMTGLKVNNPQSYTDEHFLTLDKADLAVGLGSLMKEEVRVPRFILDGITLNIERKDGKANYDVIMQNLEKLSSGQTAQEEGPSKKFVIDELAITHVTVNLKGFGVGGQTVKVPDIKMTNVGSDGSGVDSKQITGIIMSSIFQALAQNVANLPGALVEGLGNGLKNLGPLTTVGAKVIGDVADVAGEVVGGVANKAGSVVGGAGKAAGDTAKQVGKKVGAVGKDIGKGLGNLLGGDQKKTPEEAPAKE